MADTAWYNLLPTAPNIATGTQAAQQAAATAQGASTAAASASYDLDLKKTVEALAAASMGPQGVDQDKFYRLASGTPYGVSAIKAYADTIFPQMQKQTAETAPGQVLDENGSVGGAQTSQAMQANPNMAGTVLGTAMGLQKQQFGNAADIAKARTTVQAVSPNAFAGQPPTDPTGAQPGSIGGNAGMQVQTPTVGAGNYKGDFSVDQYAKLSPQDQAALRRGMIGVTDELDNPINENSSPASIASAARKLQATQFTAGLPGVDINNIGSTIEKTGAANNGGPAVGIKAIQDAIGRGYSLKGTNLSQTGAAFSNMGAGQEQHAVGFYQGLGADLVSPSNKGEVENAYQGLKWLHNSQTEAQSLNNQKTLASLSDDQFARKIATMLQPIASSEDISTVEGRQNLNSLFRTHKSLGKIVNDADGLPGLTVDAIKNSIAAQDRPGLLSDIADIDNQLIQTGGSRSTLNAKSSAGKVVLPWEHWSNQPTGGNGSPKPGDKNSEGQVWTGKRWL